jgi:two-component system, LytTR family, sensor kinase
MAAAMLWSILGVFFALPGLSSPHSGQTLLGSLAQWWSWGLITPLIFWTDGTLPFKEQQLGMRVLAHLVASIFLTVLYFYLFVGMRAAVGLNEWGVLADRHFLPDAFRGGLLWSWLVYWIIFGVRQTFRYYEHYLASELRLGALRIGPKRDSLGGDRTTACTSRQFLAITHKLVRGRR